MRKPTIHLNGSSPDTLYEQYTNASRAIAEAIDALREAAPHGRDYYPQEGDGIREATAEHVARLAKLESVLAEVKELTRHVANERSVRERRRAGATT